MVDLMEETLPVGRNNFRHGSQSLHSDLNHSDSTADLGNHTVAPHRSSSTVAMVATPEAEVGGQTEDPFRSPVVEFNHDEEAIEEDQRISKKGLRNWAAEKNPRKSPEPYVWFYILIPVYIVLVRQIQVSLGGRVLVPWEPLTHLITLLSFAVTILFACVMAAWTNSAAPEKRIKNALRLLLIFHAVMMIGAFLGAIQILIFPVWLNKTNTGATGS